MSRVSNSIKNVSFAITGQFISLLITFLSRMIFIKYLGDEYLGIDGLFTNILSILSLADLGIGTAINFSLYKPLAEKDENQLLILMNLYKKVYFFIGIIVLVIGISITPFIKFFINNNINIDNIYLIYILYVLNSATTYLFTYKRSLIIASQKDYITTIVHYIIYFIVNILQITIIIITKNFILYLIIKFMFNFIENFILSIIANKMFPYLKKNTNEKIGIEVKTSIIKNIKAMIFHKIGGVCVLATDNLLISRFVNIVSVGLYSNYLMIIQAINSLLSHFFNGIIASVGDLAVLNEKKVVKEKFNIINFLGFWLFSISSICLFILLNPFIEIWIGKQFTFNIWIVLVIVLNFFLNGMRQATLTFRTALGLFWYDRYKPVFEAIINLSASIILVNRYGIIGVLIGTTISILTTCFWIEPYILYKYGLDDNPIKYFKVYFKYFILTIFAFICTKLVIRIFVFNGILGFLFEMIICIIVPNLIYIFFFHRCYEFKYLEKLIINIIRKVVLRIKVKNK
ncbi:hypothetical protein QYZ59_04740 [Clostridium perfringens]|uniref:lipopolysaccharide biosynthesis protein n=2 Tax=Clostridium perfringens TaxID=1502 RepID=UPI00263A9892|nr:hypothetical protein [Clostridium perfringens]EJT6496127.1 hypothetical protein [Clostridium perfringens]EJT6497042.1 hypothetical protein [Clostridium perfringens]MDN4739591.1 hypothetical protein [Clostridium perfringens]